MTSSTSLPQRRLSKDRNSSMLIYDFLATGFIPEWIIRLGIRKMLEQKLQEQLCPDEDLDKRRKAFAAELRQLPIALATELANDQHYEVPTEFFQLILGKYLKYSCCSWASAKSLDEAELEMLELSSQRARLLDGQEILDLGCGWGAFTLYAAQKYPNSKITAVSNSGTQKIFIEQRARELNLANITVITADINELTLPQKFDRIVSVEMMEHAKNYEKLFEKLRSFLKNDGKMFVHIFTHRQYQYHFGSTKDDWLAKYFFTGGTMPSNQLFYEFQKELEIEDYWAVNGREYQKTAEAWLRNMDFNKQQLKKIISETYGPSQVTRWWIYWRLFFLACSELWGFRGGNEWMVSHYLFGCKQL